MDPNQTPAPNVMDVVFTEPRAILVVVHRREGNLVAKHTATAHSYGEAESETMKLAQEGGLAWQACIEEIPWKEDEAFWIEFTGPHATWDAHLEAEARQLLAESAEDPSLPKTLEEAVQEDATLAPQLPEGTTELPVPDKTLADFTPEQMDAALEQGKALAQQDPEPELVPISSLELEKVLEVPTGEADVNPDGTSKATEGAHE